MFHLLQRHVCNYNVSDTGLFGVRDAYSLPRPSLGLYFRLGPGSLLKSKYVLGLNLKTLA